MNAENTMTLDEALEGRFIFDGPLGALCYEKRGERRFALVYGSPSAELMSASWDVECYEFELRALGLVRRDELLAGQCVHPPAVQLPLPPVRPERWRVERTGWRPAT